MWYTVFPKVVLLLTVNAHVEFCSEEDKSYVLSPIYLNAMSVIVSAVLQWTSIIRD